MRMPKSIATLERHIDAKIKSLGEAGRFMSPGFPPTHNEMTL